MSHLRRLGSEFSVPLPADGGYWGRQCPNSECEGYFKVMAGTGLSGDDLQCHCPYCGHSGLPSEFATDEQKEYALSVVARRIGKALVQDFRRLEFHHRPIGFGIGLTLDVEGRLSPIRYYRERLLETELVCDSCGLNYAVYGVFAYCPDCGTHNSLQILRKNLEVTLKMLDFAGGLEQDVRTVLIEDALEDCISSFDGFGRELCHVAANKTSVPERAKRITFQNLDAASSAVGQVFNIDLAFGLQSDDWPVALRGFQKRHLLAHKAGVIDAEYMSRCVDVEAVVGRKVVVSAEEVSELARILGHIAAHFYEALEKVE